MNEDSGTPVCAHFQFELFAFVGGELARAYALKLVLEGLVGCKSRRSLVAPCPLDARKLLESLLDLFLFHARQAQANFSIKIGIACKALAVFH